MREATVWGYPYEELEVEISKNDSVMDAATSLSSLKYVKAL